MSQPKKKQENWTCSRCTYVNTPISKQCEMCDYKKQKQLLKLPDMKKQNKQQLAMIQCSNSKCKKLNNLNVQNCVYCQQSIFGQEKQQQIKQQKKQKINLINCSKCNFENDPMNAICVNCDKKLVQKKIRTKSVRPYKAGFYGRGARGICPECGELSEIDYSTGLSQICNKCVQLEKVQIQKNYCMFCFKDIPKQQRKLHQNKCEQRIKFFKREGNPTFDRCTDLQYQTMIYMHRKCQIKHYNKQKLLVARLQKLGFNKKDLQNLHHYIVNYAPIIIHMHVNTHFHYFLKDTHYRNQFQTSLSSGSLSHSARTTWEDRMFDRKHHYASGFQRVKYGTMNFVNDPTGVRACMGYGQSYFLLKSHVRDRCTITDMDSSSSTATLGTFRFIFHLLMKLSDAQIKSAFQGSKGIQMLSHVIGTYKQIQIHGPVQFSKDIQRVYVSKAQLKLGDPQALLEQVKTFCLKHKIDYELFQGNSNHFGMGVLPVQEKQAPVRIVQPKKELSEKDLKPPEPPAPVPAPLFGGFGGGFGYAAGFAPAPLPAYTYVYRAPVVVPPRPPPKKNQYGVDYI